MAQDRLMVGVSGVRGTIGSMLTPNVAMDFGCALGAMLGKGKTVTLARDTRPSGPMIAHALSAGLLASGINVIDLGMVTSPGAYLMTRKLGADAGVIVTASHNPPAYNGIKFLQSKGWGFTAAMAQQLKETWESRRFNLQPTAGVGVESRNNRTHSEHIDTVLGVLDATLVASKRFKVVLDSINGAGCVVSPMFLGKLGCELAHINAEPTGDFAHEPEPIEQNLTGLCEAVRRHKAAAGFAQDPDADRLVVVDETGRFIGEEYTLALAAAFVLRHRKGTLATNLSTSRMIDDIAARAGCSVLRSPTGESNVNELMVEQGCIFGGEGNGGVIEPRVVYGRNSLVGMGYILQYLAETGKKLSELVAEIPAYVMLKTKMPAPAGLAAKVAQAAREHFAALPGAKMDERDGLRIDLPDGWVNVRASNTEPIMRIMAEAADAKTAQSLIDQVQQLADKM